MKVSVGNLDLLESICVLVPSGETLKCVLDDGKDDPLAIEVSFTTESTKTGASVDVKLKDSKTAVITFINQTSVLGSLLKEPAKLGDYSGRELFLSYFVAFMTSTGGHKCHLFFFLGAKLPA